MLGDVSKQVLEQLPESGLVSDNRPILLYDERCVRWIDGVPGGPSDRAESDRFTLTYVTPLGAKASVSPMSVSIRSSTSSAVCRCVASGSETDSETNSVYPRAEARGFRGFC